MNSCQIRKSLSKLGRPFLLGAVLILLTTILSPTLPLAAGVPVNSWSNTGSLITARWKHTATLLPTGKVLVAGGNNGTTSINSTEFYDPATGTCTATGPLTTARSAHTATLLPSGRVLAVGGGIGSTALSSTRVLRSGRGELDGHRLSPCSPRLAHCHPADQRQDSCNRGL